MCLLRLWAATISTQRITGRPVARMMENWEQMSASSFSRMRVWMGWERKDLCSLTSSSLVMKAQVSRSWETASYSS